jgi:hypothetical protein
MAANTSAEMLYDVCFSPPISDKEKANGLACTIVSLWMTYDKLRQVVRTSSSNNPMATVSLHIQMGVSKRSLARKMQETGALILVLTSSGDKTTRVVRPVLGSSCCLHHACELEELEGDFVVSVDNVVKKVPEASSSASNSKDHKS